MELLLFYIYSRGSPWTHQCISSFPFLSQNFTIHKKRFCKALQIHVQNHKNESHKHYKCAAQSCHKSLIIQVFESRFLLPAQKNFGGLKSIVCKDVPQSSVFHKVYIPGIYTLIPNENVSIRVNSRE